MRGEQRASSFYWKRVENFDWYGYHVIPGMKLTTEMLVFYRG
jgi:hypothetical protein